MKTFTYLVLLFAAECSAQSVVINEVYGAGGNTGALFTHDYIELYNGGGLPVDLGGWSVQYASATGTGAWQITLLSGVIEPGRTFLIQGAGGVNGSPLPLADVTGTLSMAATAGKVALVQSVTPLSRTCPISLLVIDQVGYGGSANCFEGAGPAPAPSATFSAQRQTDGVDSDNNATDFRTAAPTPANSLPRSQVITFAAIGNRTYGDAPIAVIASASSGLEVVLTSADPSIASVEGMTVTILGAGDVELIASQAGNSTFAPATAVQSLHVAKATLNVTAVSTSRVAGMSNPPFQIQYSGFVGTDNESVLDLLPVASCTADIAALPGDYPINVTGGEDNNYQFAYTSGVLSVLPSAAASPSFIQTPANGAMDVFVIPTIKCAAVSGATTYFLQLSTEPSFTSFIELQGSRLIPVPVLNYSTTYYARVRTDQTSEFGRITQFTTGNPAQFAMLVSPTDRTPGVGLSYQFQFALVPASTTYSFELSKEQTFTTILSKGTGSRRQGVLGLEAGATYFVRVKTDLSPDWGPVRSFHTATTAELCFLRYPAERASRISWLREFILNDAGATAYVVQFSEAVDFTSPTEFGPVGVRFTLTNPLKYRTHYYTRVCPASDPGNWGPVRGFTTAHPADFSLLRVPADGAENIDTLARLVLFPVPGATTYELSLSTSADFSTDDVHRDASTRWLRLALRPFTTYYARIRTNLSAEWGRTTRFTTAGGGKASVASREATAGGLALEEGVPGTGDPEPTSLRAFPNPFTESVTICPGEAAFVSVWDFQGKVVFTWRASSHECCELGVAWSPGIYIATLVNGTDRRTIRLVKK